MNDLFDLTKLGIGFNVFDLARSNFYENVKKSQTNFPPYNIKKESEGKYVVEIPAAGYDLADFKIELEEDVLRISCTPPKEEEDNFIWRGLTSKQWTRQFILNEGVEVKNATLFNGMLKIFLEQIAKKEKKVIQINIEQPKAKNHPQLLNEDSNL